MSNIFYLIDGNRIRGVITKIEHQGYVQLR